MLGAVAARFGHSFELPEALIGAAALGRNLPPLRMRRSRRPDRPMRSCSGPSAIRRRSRSVIGPSRSGAAWHPESPRPGANLRPARVWPSLESAGPLKPEVLAGTDMLVVRELTGGLYYGEPLEIEADGSSAHNTMRYSRAEIERSPDTRSRLRRAGAGTSRRSTKPTCSKPHGSGGRWSVTLALRIPA